MKSMHYFLGIDPSLSGCGIFVQNACGENSLWSVIKTKPAKTPTDRIKRYLHIASQIVALIEDKKGMLCIRIEGYSFASKGRAITSLAELRGVLIDKLMPYSNDIEEVPPGSLKKFFTGMGNASKEQMLLAAKERGHDFGKKHDLADAYALSEWGRTGKKT